MTRPTVAAVILTTPLILFGWVVPAGAQQCASGRAPQPSLGIGTFHCQAGTCVVGSAIGTMQAERDRPTPPPYPDRGVRYDFTTEPGLWRIDDDGPAAGRLREGDVLVAVNDLPITTREAGRVLSRMTPGEPIRLTVRRSNRMREVTIEPALSCEPLHVSAGADPQPPHYDAGVVSADPPAEPRPGRADRPVSGTTVIESLGLTLIGEQIVQVDAGGAVRWSYAEPPVVLAVEAGGRAAQAGIRPGTVLLEVAGEPATSRDASRLLVSPPQKGPLIFRIRVGEAERMVLLPGG